MIIKIQILIIYIVYAVMSLGIWLLPVTNFAECAGNKRIGILSRLFWMAGMILFWPWAGLVYGFFSSRRKPVAILSAFTFVMFSAFFIFICAGAVKNLGYKIHGAKLMENFIAPLRWQNNWDLYTQSGDKDTGFGMISVVRSEGFNYVNYRPYTDDAPVTHIYSDIEVSNAFKRRLLPAFILSFQLTRNEPVYYYGSPFSNDVLFSYTQMLVTYLGRYFEMKFGIESTRRQRYLRDLVIQKDVFNIGRLAWIWIARSTRPKEAEEIKKSVHRIQQATPLEKMQQYDPLSTQNVYQRRYTINDLLIEAVYEANPRKITELLDKGANVNFISKFGYTPLMEASQLGYPSIVRLLLSWGADPSTKRVNGDTALSLARLNYRHEIVSILQEINEKHLSEKPEKTAADIN